METSGNSDWTWDFFLGNLWSSGKSLVKQYASTFDFFVFFSNRKNMKNKTDVNVDLLWFVFLPGARNGLIWMLFLARDHKIVT